MATTLYHGSRDALDGTTLLPGLCLTTDERTAAAYAGPTGTVYAITAEWPAWAPERKAVSVLAQEGIPVGEYVWEAIDRHLHVLGEYYDGVEYADMDPLGGSHQCYRLLEPVEALAVEAL